MYYADLMRGCINALAAHLRTNVCTGASRCAAKCIDACSHEMLTLQSIAAAQAELNEVVSRQALALALKEGAAFALPIYNLVAHLYSSS
jgi:hypothetical protein